MSGETAERGNMKPEHILLPIEAVGCFSLNPRHTPNPLQTQLEAAIQATNGLSTPLQVTKRPGEKDYTISHGGKSRLLALKALYARTRDEKFAKVECIIEPFESDFTLAIQHFRENNLHGTLSYNECAKEILTLRKLYCSIVDTKNPTDTDFLTWLKDEAGIIRYKQDLSKAKFLIEELSAALPFSISRCRVSRRTVEALRGVKAKFKKVWADYKVEGSFDELFADLLLTQDQALENANLEASDDEVIEATIDIPALLTKIRHELTVCENVDLTIPVIARLFNGSNTGPAMKGEQYGDENAEGREDEGVLDFPTSKAISPATHATGANTSKVDTFETLRASIWESAITLATRNNIAPLINQTEGGFGFIIGDIHQDLAHDELPSSVSAWRCLVELCMLTSTPRWFLKRYISHDTPLFIILSKRNYDLLSPRGCLPGLPFASCYHALSDPDARLIDTLLQQTRKLIHLAKSLDGLWQLSAAEIERQAS